jgi:predicted Holliday junction resolvase-like endonuclease
MHLIILSLFMFEEHCSKLMLLLLLLLLLFIGSDVETLRREMDARDEEWQKKLKQKESELEELRKV